VTRGDCSAARSLTSQRCPACCCCHRGCWRRVLPGWRPWPARAAAWSLSAAPRAAPQPAPGSACTCASDGTQTLLGCSAVRLHMRSAHWQQRLALPRLVSRAIAITYSSPSNCARSDMSGWAVQAPGTLARAPKWPTCIWKCCTFCPRHHGGRHRAVRRQPCLPPSAAACVAAGWLPSALCSPSCGRPHLHECCRTVNKGHVGDRIEQLGSLVRASASAEAQHSTAPALV
jgi:hypothetical protein